MRSLFNAILGRRKKPALAGKEFEIPVTRQELEVAPAITIPKSGKLVPDRIVRPTTFISVIDAMRYSQPIYTGLDEIIGPCNRGLKKKPKLKVIQ